MIKKLICASALIFSTSVLAENVTFNAIVNTGCDSIDANIVGPFTFDLGNLNNLNSFDDAMGEQIENAILGRFPNMQCRFMGVQMISLHNIGPHQGTEIIYDDDFMGQNAGEVIGNLRAAGQREIHVRMIHIEPRKSARK